MTKQLIVDSFDTPKLDESWRLDESIEISEFENTAKNKVDGKNILARCSGPFFLIDGESKNNRYYSRGLWESAISKNKERIDQGGMLGTISHEQPIDDKALLEGLISHRMTRLWIDENKKVGMGEFVILNTKAGQNLNALMRGGVNVKVSSRAEGEFNGKRPNGSQIIDEKSFDLTGFDIVLRPGVPTAIPVIVENENLNSPDDTKITTTDQKQEVIKENNFMSEAILENIIKDKNKLETSLNEALTKIDGFKRESDALRNDLENRSNEKKKLEESFKEVSEKVTAVETKLNEAETELNKFKALGSYDDLHQSLDSSIDLLGKYKEFGSVDELTEAFEKATKIIEEYKELGSPEELSDILTLCEEYVAIGDVTVIKEDLEAYAALGSAAELNSLVNVTEKIADIGSVDQLNDLVRVLESYKDLGTPDEISQALAMSEAVIKKFQSETTAKAEQEIVEKFGVNPETVHTLVEKYGKDEAVKLLESIKVNDVSHRYRKEKTDESVKTLTESVIDDSGNANLKGSRLSRLISQHSR